MVDKPLYRRHLRFVLFDEAHLVQVIVRQIEPLGVIQKLIRGLFEGQNDSVIPALPLWECYEYSNPMLASIPHHSFPSFTQ